MDSDNIWRIVRLIILVILSGLFSAAETALTTVNLNKLRALEAEGGRTGRRAARVLKLRDESPRMLSAVLIGNNVVNLSASSLTTVLCTSLFGSRFIGAATGVITFLILVFGEITPKNLATVYSLQLSLLFAGPVKVIMIVLTPLIWLLNHISRGIFFLLRIDPDADPNQMTESELRQVVDVSGEEGVIEPTEQKMITNVVDFGDAVAKDIMIPRTDMVCISEDISREELLRIVEEESYTRLPVYARTRDKIIGILHIKDLFIALGRHRDGNVRIRDLMRKPVYVYEYQRTAQIFADMKTSSSTMCIVLDEYGTTAGLITMEDLVEEIVGDIRDEYDSEEAELIRRISEGKYSVDGAVKLDDLNDSLGTELHSEYYDSVGGLMIELLDRLPQEGDTAVSGGIRLTCTGVFHNRVERVEIDTNEVPASPEEDQRENE